MKIEQAIKIISDKSAVYGMPLLDMAIVMKELLASDDLAPDEAMAIRVFVREGRKLFAPV